MPPLPELVGGTVRELFMVLLYAGVATSIAIFFFNNLIMWGIYDEHDSNRGNDEAERAKADH